MLIDFHTHAFPDAMADRTMQTLSRVSGLEPETDGTLDALNKKMDEWGTDYFVLHNIATRPSQQTTINNYAASIQGGRMFCFGTVHPDAPDAVQEVERIAELGLSGVKLHPDYQDFFIQEPRMNAVYDAIEQLGLPVLFHAGYDPLSPDLIHATPEGVADVNRRFPRMRVIAAHLGGIADLPAQRAALLGRDVYLDISVTLWRTTPEEFRDVVFDHGIERILFGSDCPWGNSPDNLERLDRIGLTQQEKNAICYNNAAKILGLPCI
ncbi:MAG: amidohydrolase family protein [Bacillota bacterium]